MGWVDKIKNLTGEQSLEYGGKAANLGEMAQNGYKVPPGFCLSGRALDYHIDVNNLLPGIKENLGTMDFDDYEDIEDKSTVIREMIEKAPMPADLAREVRINIDSLDHEASDNPFVAVRSSAAVRNSDVTSFPGMMDTYHFIRGEDDILSCIRNCWASLYTARAIFRRHQQGIVQTDGVIAPLVQKMVDADVAGVLFTANPVSMGRDECVVEANWGLGESLVSGEALVDYFILSKEEPRRIKLKRVMKKNIMVTKDKEKGIGRKKYELTGNMVTNCTLTDEQLFELAALGVKLENLFGVPQNIEWAYEDGELFLLQAGKIKTLK